MPTLSYYPKLTLRKTIKPRALIAAFGDGYEQRTADGINTQLARLDVSFSGVSATMDAIEAFLIARKATESFDWVYRTGFYVCREWSREEHGRGLATISCGFDQVPA